MNGLNSEQTAAIDALNTGSVAVLAGPGSGKTHTLVAAIQSLFEHNSPTTLCLTFTNKAADNLRQQLAPHSGLFVGTFHALAAQICRTAGQPIRIVPGEEALDIMGTLKRRQELRDSTIRECLLTVSQYKNGGLNTSSARQLALAYDEELTARGFIDYDDLITHCLESIPASTHYDYIFVDEFQDTSPKQYELLKKLTDKPTKLFVIGDPKQSIYKFRGADGSIFARIQADADPKVIDLRHNYRSAPAIIEAANAIFPELTPQLAVRAEPGMVRVIETLDEYSQADYIVRIIEHALGGIEWHSTHHDKQWLQADRFADFAVLYRTRRQGKIIAEKLRANSIPVQCLGEESPFATPIVQLVKAMLGYALQPDQEQHSRVEKAAKRTKIVGASSLLDDIDTQKAPQTIVHRLAEQLGKSDNEALLQLEQLAARYTHISKLYAHLNSLADQAFFDPDADTIHLSTIHASKGLEFQHVFVAGCIEGVLPSSKATEPEDIAEEQRLFYVAITRARDSLFLLHTRHQDKQAATPSSFLKLLPVASEIDDQLATILKQRQRTRLKHSQQQLF